MNKKRQVFFSWIFLKRNYKENAKKIILKNLKKPKKNELTDVEKEEIINEVLKRLEIKTNSVVRKVRLAMIEEIENEIDFVKAE